MTCTHVHTCSYKAHVLYVSSQVQLNLKLVTLVLTMVGLGTRVTLVWIAKGWYDVAR